MKYFYIRIFLILLSAIIVLHFSILVKIIPYNIAWGGRLKNDQEMYVFETFSLLINAFLIWVILMKSKIIKQQLSTRILNIILFIFIILFALNTVGNLFAETYTEKFFAFITFLFAYFTWKLRLEK